VSRLSARVVRLENYFGGGPAVARIIRVIENSSDAELARLNEGGVHSRLSQMAKGLSDRQLVYLIDELKAMRARLKEID